tara:strand:- start:46859 stop:47587 length:729 start_codon:yes stop_codon:yes gene_type:complete
MLFENLIPTLQAQWDQPEKKYPFMIAVATSILVASSSSLAIIPGLALIASMTALSYGGSLIANYFIKLSKKMGDVIDHLDETIINTNKRVVEAEQTLANAKQVVSQLSETMTKVDSRVAEAEQTISVVNKAVNQVNNETLPELTERLKTTLAGADQAISAGKQTVESLKPRAEGVLQDTAATLGNLNSAARTIGTYAAPLTYVADALRGGGGATQGDDGVQPESEQQASRQRHRNQPFIGIM